MVIKKIKEYRDLEFESYRGFKVNTSQSLILARDVGQLESKVFSNIYNKVEDGKDFHDGLGCCNFSIDPGSGVSDDRFIAFFYKSVAVILALPKIPNDYDNDCRIYTSFYNRNKLKILTINPNESLLIYSKKGEYIRVIYHSNSNELEVLDVVNKVRGISTDFRTKD